LTRIYALYAGGRARARRGELAAAPLDEALALAEPTGECARIGPVRAARAEAEWLAGDNERAIAEAGAVIELMRRYPHAWYAGDVFIWLWRAGWRGDVPRSVAAPFAREIVGDWADAAALWQELGCSYEAALALLVGDEAAVRRAHATFEGLGARPALAIAARRLRELGVRDIPRGRRNATLANPAGLTRREAEVLSLLAKGLRNAEIAERLFVAPKTVDHHVSAILAKLGVRSRTEAVQAATYLDLPPQDGETADH
jgi:DNA-binding CsgD family transcriptional regulator